MPDAQTRPVILVVDDAPENLAILTALLKRDYIVRPANNGALALRLAQAESPPDLILLDIMMPDMDGYEVMRRLQQEPRTADIPVIFCTALAEFEHELKGLALGAVDYIAKPFNHGVVTARVRTQLALRAARRELEVRNRQLQQERDLIENILARLIQTEQFDARYLRYILASVDRSNGDVLLSAFTPDGRQWLLVGDISGHGPTAAVCAPLLGHIFYSRAAEDGEADVLLAELNQVMYQRLPLQVFMAFALLEVSPERDQLRVWNGGLPGCILLDGKRQGRRVESAFTPLGLLARLAPRGADCLAFTPGDRFYLYTDGVSEIENAQGVSLGDQAALEMLQAMNPEAALEELVASFARYHGEARFRDDLTLVELRH